MTTHLLFFLKRSWIEKKNENIIEVQKKLKLKRDGTIGTYGMMEAASKRTTYIQAQSEGK